MLDKTWWLYILDLTYTADIVVARKPPMQSKSYCQCGSYQRASPTSARQAAGILRSLFSLSVVATGRKSYWRTGLTPVHWATSLCWGLPQRIGNPTAAEKAITSVVACLLQDLLNCAWTALKWYQDRIKLPHVPKLLQVWMCKPANCTKT